MESILPKKYNNKVVIGLAVALAVAIGVAVYLYMNSGKSEGYHNDHHVPQQNQPINPTKIDSSQSGKPALVLLWAAWCGHSTAMKPTWDKIAHILKSEGAVDVYEFEADKDKNVITAAQAKIPDFGGFPDIRFFPQGFDLDKPSLKHQGHRSEEEILAFAYGNLNK